MYLPLNNIPSQEWENEYAVVLSDLYIQKKYNRPSRVKEKEEYVNQYLPEVKTSPGIVIDLGPGPGEFLEVCRHYGNRVFGYDAKIGESEMGFNYIKLSSLMAIRQKLNIKYVGFDNLLKEGKLPFESGTVKIVNSQGSIEQIFKEHLEGVPLREHLDCRKMTWNITEKCKDDFRAFFIEVGRILKPGGICLIFGNGSSDNTSYDKMVEEIIETIPFLKVTLSEIKRLHKVVKVS